MQEITIVIEQVSKTYPNQDKVLKDINLTIKPAEFICLIGPSGCGKSTLLNLIAGLDIPTSGNIKHNDTIINKLSDNESAQYRASNIGFIYQFFNLLPSLTVKENLGLPLDIINYKNKSKREQLIRQALIEVDMEKYVNHFPQQLSGGQMQRIAIARALIHHPLIIIADEPTGNLDSDNGSKVMQLLTDANKRLQTTLILVTHDETVANFASRRIHIKDGQIIS